MRLYQYKNKVTGQIDFNYEGEEPLTVGAWGDRYEEIVTEILGYDKLLALRAVHQQRISEYPSLSDQMDAMYKARQGNPAPLAAIDAQITLIKTKYPKP